jgi:aminoglycoside phosphotransferase (APT) family kinase protein
MPYIAGALDPADVQREFSAELTHLVGDKGAMTVRAITILRHKPGRRCVIEYDVELSRPSHQPVSLELIGKVRTRHSPVRGLRLLQSLRNLGFSSPSHDGILVPEPIGIIEKYRMAVQRKVPGKVLTELLTSSSAEPLVRRVAEAAHKLHRAGVQTDKTHTMSNELDMLRDRLALVASAEKRWAQRLEQLLTACTSLASTVRNPVPRGIHRDFYADQVLVDRDQLYLIDFDLYCVGDPALDIGNFIGHITEFSLRTFGNPSALMHLEQALEERFVELAGAEVRAAVQAYATLTLARHIYLSTLFENRRPLTETILELCEDRLQARQRHSVYMS